MFEWMEQAVAAVIAASVTSIIIGIALITVKLYRKLGIN